jgi:hypothetical protein
MTPHNPPRQALSTLVRLLSPRSSLSVEAAAAVAGAAAALTNRSSLNDDQLDNAITLLTQVR